MFFKDQTPDAGPIMIKAIISIKSEYLNYFDIQNVIL